jgi:predicted  nucleic acid-binding Zn-ribbon protein
VGDVTLAAVLTAVGGFITAAVAAAVAYSKGRADARKTAADARTVEVEADKQEAAIDAAEAKARQKIKQDGEAWAVKQAQEQYERLASRVDKIIESEARCQIRLATVETQYADLKEQHMELKRQHEETKARLARLEGVSNDEGNSRTDR